MKLKKKRLLSLTLCLSLLVSYSSIYALDTTPSTGASTSPSVTTPKTDTGTTASGSTNVTTPDSITQKNVDVVVGPAKTKLNISRIAGSDRYDTSAKVRTELLKIAEKENNLSEYIYNTVIASGETFADALTAGTFATEIDAPLLLTRKSDVPKSIEESIEKNASNKYLIVGGEKTINMEVLFPHSPLSGFERISGKDRWHTATSVYHRIADTKKINITIEDIALYNGTSFADALSGSAFMYQYNKNLKGKITPLLPYTNGNSRAIKLFGGNNSLPDKHIELYPEGTRYAGSNRYKTAIEVAKAYKTQLNKDIETIVLVSGESYPDALSATPLACKKDAAILLTGKGKLNSDTLEFIKATPSIKNVIIVGGNSSVSQEAEKELSELVR